MKIAVFVSGRGTNFSAIARAVKKGRIRAKLALLVCDNPRAGALSRARRAGVKIALVERKNFAGKDEFEQKISEYLAAEKIDLIVLAGFMRLLSPQFVRRYSGRVLNIHPSLLPAFKGTAGIKEAFDYGVRITGVTAHLVDEELDHGPIILQQAVKIAPSDTLESLEAKIHCLEHRLYPEAIRLFVEGKVQLEGRRARITAVP
ncbi:MAG: phosphoribosylglycinamide formyltransferase [Candidatus Omnitrophota bacterium]|nr:phosphoribosylglycinamide formyltransferase [Candidatus Omnitrophota bacterium]